MLALLVVETLQHLGVTLKGDLELHGVIEDETTGNGTLAIVAAGHDVDGAVILDGAYGATAVVGHPGYLNFTVRTAGKGAPSCRAELGVNAIEKMYPIIERLRAVEAAGNASRPAPWDGVAHPVNFNPGVIRGGDWTGGVATWCELEAQLSFLGPETRERARARIRAEVAAACEADPWLREHPARVDFHDLSTDPVLLEPEDAFVESLDAACRRAFGEGLTRRLVTGWCDIRHYQVGRARPAVLFGPGKGGGAHREDEYFETSEWLTHGLALVDHVLRWCGVEAR